MLARVIFCSAVIIATLVVILLALLSSLHHNKATENNSTGSWLALSLYIQQPSAAANPNSHPVPPSEAGALIFHRSLTEGPENTTRVVGKAQGFIIPLEEFADSVFNIIYLTFHTRDYSGSISIQANNSGNKETELTVVGGTGSFAFARGYAILGSRDSSSDEPSYIYLYLKFPNRSHTIPG